MAAALAVVLATTLAVGSGVCGADAATRHGRGHGKSGHGKKNRSPADPPTDLVGEVDGAIARIKASRESSPEATSTVTAEARHRGLVDPNRRVVYHRRVCPEGGPGTNAALIGDCRTAQNVCRAAGHPEGTAVWTWVGPAGQSQAPSSAWQVIGYRCLVPGQEEPDLVPVLTQRQLRELPLPPGHAYVEPEGRPVLINVPTNVYVKAPTATLHTTVLGRPVEVEAIADSYIWDFGDGETLATRDPGGPYPAMTTTHTYTSPGPAKITLTTIYTARFRFVGDTQWLPAEGTAQVPSAPITIELIETRAVLVP